MEDEKKIDNYDRLMGLLHGLPDVVVSKPSTIRTLSPLIGASQTYIVQTYRQKDKGDTIFVEGLSAEGSFRLAIPPKVAEAIARQRDALTDKARSKAAKASAADRKQRGIQPAFLTRRAPSKKVRDEMRKNAD